MKEIIFGIPSEDKSYTGVFISEMCLNISSVVSSIIQYQYNSQTNELLFNKDVFIEIQNFNKNLKILGKRANIARPITNKTGRHTNAKMWIRFGADRPVLSKMMGHEREQTTQNYYKVNLRKIIEGTKAVDFERFAMELFTINI